MFCPFCKSAMVIMELNEVEVDHCFECGGVWLDSGELEQLIDNRPLQLEEVQTNEHPLKCPICSRKMKKVLWSKGKSLILDKCDQDGLWFDNGELLTILENEGKDESNQIVSLLKEVFHNKLEKEE